MKPESERWERGYCCVPAAETSRERELRRLAEEYHRRTEEYDSRVCSGPIVRGSIMPADGYEMSAINRNARAERERMYLAARRHGYDKPECNEAIFRVGEEIHKRHKHK